MIHDRFRDALEGYLLLIKARRPMVMYRYGDGETMLMDGAAVGANTQASRVDLWEAPEKLTALGRDLRTALETQGPCFHFGIPCLCCNQAGYERLAHFIRLSSVFPANLFINANHHRFLDFLPEFDGLPVAIVANERAEIDNLPFMVTRRLSVPDDCVNQYELHRSTILARARAFAAGLESRSVVLVAAGPMAEALIFFMWNTNPNHTYVDIGSALDEHFYGMKTRPYMIEGNEYAKKRCPLPDSVEATEDRVEDARYLCTNDDSVREVVVPLPAAWWSRGREYAWAEKFAAADQVVLDAACGISHPFKFWLAQNCREAHACDLDSRITNNRAIMTEIKGDLGDAAAHIVRTKRLIPKVLRVEADITRLPYVDRKFDRVFCISVLEHMAPSARAIAVAEFGRVLKKGGLVVMTFDVPMLDPETFIREVLSDGLFELAGNCYPIPPANALFTAMYGLRCFRVAMKRK